MVMQATVEQIDYSGSYAARPVHRIQSWQGWTMLVTVIATTVAGVAVNVTAQNPETGKTLGTASGVTGGQAVVGYITSEGQEHHAVKVNYSTSPASVTYRIIVARHKATEG